MSREIDECLKAWKLKIAIIIILLSITKKLSEKNVKW